MVITDGKLCQAEPRMTLEMDTVLASIQKFNCSSHFAKGNLHSTEICCKIRAFTSAWTAFCPCPLDCSPINLSRLS